MAPNIRIEDPVVSQAIHQINSNRITDLSRVSKLEDRFNSFEKDNIHNNYKLRDMIVDAVSQGMKPLMEENKIMSGRIRIVEDLPKTRSHKFVTWAFAAAGTIIVALTLALIKTKFNI